MVSQPRIEDIDTEECISLRIQGGQPVGGKIRVSGAKNSATRLLAASLLASSKVTLRNFPVLLRDARQKMSFMQKLGARIHVEPEAEQIEVSVTELRRDELADYSLPVRTTYLLAAGQLARGNIARIPYPGGCRIGSRGYDLHVALWRSLGCEVTERETFIEVAGRLSGGKVSFPISTVGGTENALLCASVARGQTEIRNAYITPEISELIAFLRQLGAQIEVHSSSLINVNGVDGLLGGTTWTVMPDRIEALTWMVFAAISGGALQIENVPFADMEIPLVHLQKAGIDFFRNSSTVLVTPDTLSLGKLHSFEVACGTHPGVISDMQPFFVLLALKADGVSRIFDYRYPDRIAYVAELSKMCDGAVSARPGEILVRGVATLRGAEVISTDLRGSMALVMAGAIADGQTTVRNAEMALRGYNGLLKKLASIGVRAELSYGVQHL